MFLQYQHRATEVLLQTGAHGSTLGPLLFLWYINSVTTGLKYCKVKIYADDLVIYNSHQCSLTANVRLQEDINVLVEWFNNNRLTLNADKTKVLWYGSDREIQNAVRLSICIKGKEMKIVNNYMYLGVKLDSRLLMKDHLKEIIKRASNKIFKLGKLRHRITEETSLLVYKQTILPILDYCGFVTKMAPNNMVGKLQKIPE